MTSNEPEASAKTLAAIGNPKARFLRYLPRIHDRSTTVGATVACPALSMSTIVEPAAVLAALQGG